VAAAWQVKDEVCSADIMAAPRWTQARAMKNGGYLPGAEAVVAYFDEELSGF
jgi:hypothetical protein